jgi:hypothetical protein
MIGKLELNFVSPELVTDSSMIGMLSYHRRYLVYFFIDRLKHTYFRYCCTSGKVCSQFEFIFSCLRNFELLQVLLLNTARKIFSSSTLSSPVKGLSGSVEWV